MYVPATFGVSIALLFICMLCWGSWANTFSLTRGKYRFELFYWDYAVGVLLGVLALSALMAPNAAVFQGTMAPSSAAWGIFSGVVFSIGNVLLVAAISLTGMAVAFPVTCGLALLIAVGLSLWINPAVPVGWMSLGAGMILLSMIMDAAAYRSLAANAASSTRGIVIAIIGGVCMGAFPPCSEKAFEGPNGLDAYSAAVMLGVGVLLCTILTNYLLMRWPITGDEPVPMKRLFTAPISFHVLGIIG